MQKNQYKIKFLNTIFFLAGASAFLIGFVRWQENVFLGIADFVFSGIFFILLFYLRKYPSKVENVASMAIFLGYVLFLAIYVSATYNLSRISLFFLLLASVVFLKGVIVGIRWLVLILISLWLPRFLPQELAVYSIEDIVFTSFYLLGFFAIFYHYERVRENQQEKLSDLNLNLNDVVEQKTTELQVANERLKQLSETDTLTKIPNRRFYNHRVTDDIFTAKRTNKPLSMLMIDIDSFKQYNDEYGHDMGDIVLRRVAEMIDEMLIRKTDSVSRFGGEEFIVLLPATDCDGAYLIAERIRSAIFALAIPNIHSPVTDRLTVSIGISSLENEQLNAADLFKLADTALFAAKQNGRNRTELSCERH